MTNLIPYIEPSEEDRRQLFVDAHIGAIMAALLSNPNVTKMASDGRLYFQGPSPLTVAEMAKDLANDLWKVRSEKKGIEP